MTLQATSSEIRIKNSAGLTKFTSNDKLVYLKWQKSNSTPIYLTSAAYYEPFYAIAANEFLVLTITLTYCSGNLGASLVNVQIPANGSILIDFSIPRVGNQAHAISEYFGCSLINTSLVFTPIRIDYFGHTISTLHGSNILYNAKIYSYL